MSGGGAARAWSISRCKPRTTLKRTEGCATEALACVSNPIHAEVDDDQRARLAPQMFIGWCISGAVASGFRAFTAREK